MASPPRICLIDDDPLVRDALALGLSDAGYDVRVVPGAAAALELIAREHIDAVITDMKMPGFDGGAFIGELRRRRSHMPVVAISGGGEIRGKGVAELAREQGADACLVKPVRAREIARVLDPLLAAKAGGGGGG